MRLDGREVAVVGAGIAGLAAAIALAARRMRVRVFEQAPALGEVGAGLQIAPNGVAVLEALGLRDAAERVASRPAAVDLHDYRRGAVARVPLGDEIVARHGRPYWHLHRADLLAVLAVGAAEAGVVIETGAPVRGIVAEGVTGLSVETETGRYGPFEAVIGADGVRSGLRAAHVTAAPPRFTRHVAWRGVVPAERVPAALAMPAARVTMGPGRHLVSYPLRDRSLVNFVAVEERAAWAEEGWSSPADPADLRRAFAGWGGEAGALLAAVDGCFLWGLFDHAPLPRWTDGRLALIGDACHPMLPFLAQGATMALEDAWVLADCLELAGDVQTGLVAYETARMARVTRVQRAAAGSGRLYHLRPPLARGAQSGLRLASAVAPGLLAGRFDWLFGADVTRIEA